MVVASTDAASASKWIYRMEVAHALPVVDLDKTPIAALLSKPSHDRFLRVMRHAYARFSTMFRVSGVLMVLVLALPRSVGCWLAVPTVLLAVPSLLCGMLMNSSDVLMILPRQYEFWFFTVLNTINWTCLATFYSDLRVLSLVGGVVGTQWVILIDANFRTVTSSIRSTRVAAPVLLVLGLATFFRVIDTDSSNFRVIPIAKVSVSLVDVFANTSLTLAIFVARKGYAKRKVLITHAAALQTIRCVVFRSKLQLKPSPLRHEAATPLIPLASPSRTDTQQQVTLVSMRLGAVDVRDTLLPGRSPLHAPLTPVKRVLLRASAVVGFVASLFTITRRPAGSELPPSALEYAVAALALLATGAFFATCAASFHRALLRSLLHNFDFLFSSVQFTLAIVLICDMVQWDFRTLGALAWLLWFHSVLTLDALTPPVRRSLGLRKIFLLPVVASSLAGIGFILYGFFFSHVAEFFLERTLCEIRFHDRTVSVRTKSLLMNRLFTILLWSCRLIWELAGCADDELIFIRGNLDYSTPMEMIPPLKAAVSPESKAATMKKTEAVKRRRWCQRSSGVVFAT